MDKQIKEKKEISNLVELIIVSKNLDEIYLAQTLGFALGLESSQKGENRNETKEN